ncbi:hypothetical protein D3C81_261050 [compost metagenome]
MAIYSVPFRDRVFHVETGPAKRPNSHCFTTVSHRLNVQQRNPAIAALRSGKTQRPQRFAAICPGWHGHCASARHIQ